MTRKGRSKSYGKSIEMVHDYPPSLVVVAKNRTRDMIQRLSLIDYDLQRLVVSAYLQGVYDTGIVAINTGYIPPGCTLDTFEKGSGI